MTCAKCNAPVAPESRYCGSCGAAVQPTAHVGDGDYGDPADQMIGREIADRYRIVAKLGEGGMGAVFRAQQMSLKRTVALKLLKPELSQDRGLVRRFNAEAELAAKLNHPNTVTLYDYGQESDGTLFIAMEFVDGQSLRNSMASDGPLSAARTLDICEQVASSLADAHARGIVHRDLKPDNVMLTTRGKRADFVTVLDFGIAKLRDERGDLTAQPMTRAGDLLGTPQYMAPEQIRGETVDGRTDVYALGAMMYEMITGRLPFEAKTLMAMLSMHLQDMPARPRDKRPELAIPAELDELVMAALQKQPDARPASMELYGDRISQLRKQLEQPRASAPGYGGSPYYAPPPGAAPLGMRPPGVPQTPPPGQTGPMSAQRASPVHTPSSHAPAHAAFTPAIPPSGPLPVPSPAVHSPPPGVHVEPSGHSTPAGPAGHGTPAPGAPYSGDQGGAPVMPAYGTPSGAAHPGAAGAHPGAAGTHPGGPGVAPRGKSRLALWVTVGVLCVAGAAVGGYFALAGGDDTQAEADGEAEQTRPVSTDFNTRPEREIFAPDGAGRARGVREDDGAARAKDERSSRNNAKSRGDDRQQAPGDRSAASLPGTSYRNSEYGYKLRAPAGFVQVPSGDPALVMFQGESGGLPTMILVAAGDRSELGGLDEDSLSASVAVLAANAGGQVVSSRKRTIRGKPRLTGIVDTGATGMRFEFVLFVGTTHAALALVGTISTGFAQTEQLRRELFHKRFTPPR